MHHRLYEARCSARSRAEDGVREVWQQRQVTRWAVTILPVGWDVDFVPAATLTFDMTQGDGSMLAADDIVQRTATVLRDRFARICSVAEALAGVAAD